jgi:hypothetical protein
MASQKEAETMAYWKACWKAYQMALQKDTKTFSKWLRGKAPGNLRPKERKDGVTDRNVANTIWKVIPKPVVITC